MCILFLRVLRILWLILLSPIQGLEPGATPAVVGGVLLVILTDRSSRKQKYLDYDVAPADGVEQSKGHAGRR